MDVCKGEEHLLIIRTTRLPSQDLEASLDNVCTGFPSTVKHDCTSFVSNYRLFIISTMTSNNTSSLCTRLGVCGGTTCSSEKGIGPSGSNFGTIFNSTAENSTLFENNNNNENRNTQPFTIVGHNNTVKYEVYNLNVNFNLNQNDFQKVLEWLEETKTGEATHTPPVRSTCSLHQHEFVYPSKTK
eukprot:TRINITY_DN5814_c0_g1_i2.p1 TRINITY_DN5814_c0_g1~~TRINITY_DN5814_c0_g1_i2.p1  ORF type:complete len:185 (+),score=23.40 TRINITY_DN5814_c0_g1_i2:382-936(+)